MIWWSDMDIRKKAGFTVFVLLVLFAILYFLINWIDEKPVSLSDEGDLTYISDEDYFVDQTYVQYLFDNITDATAQYICDMSEEIINSANSDGSALPAEYKDVIEESVYIDLDLSTQFYNLNDLKSEDSSKAENAEEIYEINIVNISLSKEKCIVDYQFLYMLRDKNSGEKYSIASNFESGPLCRLYFEKLNNKWRVIHFYMPI